MGTDGSCQGNDGEKYQYYGQQCQSILLAMTYLAALMPWGKVLHRLSLWCQQLIAGVADGVCPEQAL
jgi:hypothetical protein